MECINNSPFSREMAGESDGVDFYSIYKGNPKSRILYETRNFVVMCDLAPLTAGHLLIITREPLLSFARIPDENWSEFLEVKSRVYAALSAKYSPPMFFEHGSSSIMGEGGGCIAHAHWHVVPIAVNLLLGFEKEQYTITNINDEKELTQWAELDIPYLYYENVYRQKFVVEEVENIQRQYMRIKVAEHLEIEWPKWNWRAFINKPLLRETIATLSTYSW